MRHMPPTTRSHLLALLPIVAMLAACAEQPPEEPTRSPALAALLAAAPVVAGADTSQRDGVLGNVRHARLLTDGAGVVVADFATPFLRVFDRRGRLVTTALPRGSGPWEARSVWALAVSGGNAILVLTSTGLREFAYEADTLRFVAAHRQPADISIFTLASYCDDGWVAYTTPRTDALVDAPVLAVTSRDADGRLHWEERLRWPTLAVNRAWGKLYQMGSDGERVYIRHDYHPRAPVLAVPCEPAGDSVVVLRETQSAPDDDNEVRPAAQGEATVITYPYVLYTGFAVWNGLLIESETTTDRSSDGTLTAVTTFSVTDRGARRSVLVDGDWQILDARDGELLIGVDEPEPHVLLLPADALVSAIRGGGDRR